MSDRNSPSDRDPPTARGPPSDDGNAASAPAEGAASDEPPASEAAAVDRAAELTDYDVSEWLSLEPGEEVVWVGEPTKLRMVGVVVTGIVLIPLIVGLFVLLFAPLTYLQIKHTDYVVTNRSLYVKQGILTTNIESVDLDRIQNTEFTQSFWGKQLGFGTIDISTAGSSGADISFDDIEEAREVRDVITRAQREFAAGGERGTRDGTGGGGRTRSAASSDQLEDLVAELRATREALERVEAKLSEDRDGPAAGSATGAGPGPTDADPPPADHPDGRDASDDGYEGDGRNAPGADQDANGRAESGTDRPGDGRDRSE